VLQHVQHPTIKALVSATVVYRLVQASYMVVSMYNTTIKALVSATVVYRPVQASYMIVSMYNIQLSKHWYQRQLVQASYMVSSLAWYVGYQLMNEIKTLEGDVP
jgi:hypothetical protein